MDQNIFSSVGGSDLGEMIDDLMNDEFMVIAVTTFFLCEAIFTAFPIYRSRMKQLTSMVVGGMLGMLMLREPIAVAGIQGMLAGAATTILVARFKTPSSVQELARHLPTSRRGDREEGEHL